MNEENISLDDDLSNEVRGLYEYVLHILEEEKGRSLPKSHRLLVDFLDGMGYRGRHLSRGLGLWYYMEREYGELLRSKKKFRFIGLSEWYTILVEGEPNLENDAGEMFDLVQRTWADTKSRDSTESEGEPKEEYVFPRDSVKVLSFCRKRGYLWSSQRVATTWREMEDRYEQQMKEMEISFCFKGNDPFEDFRDRPY